MYSIRSVRKNYRAFTIFNLAILTLNCCSTAKNEQKNSQKRLINIRLRRYFNERNMQVRKRTLSIAITKPNNVVRIIHF